MVAGPRCRGLGRSGLSRSSAAALARGWGRHCSNCLPDSIVTLTAATLLTLVAFAIGTFAWGRSFNQTIGPGYAGSDPWHQYPRTAFKARLLTPKFARIALSVIRVAPFLVVGSRFASPGARSEIRASKDSSQAVSGSLLAYHGLLWLTLGLWVSGLGGHFHL